jgi:ketosteroid isomerase-like protein
MKSLLFALSASIFLGCANQSIDQKAESVKLMELSKKWSASAETNNLEKTLSYWSDDAVCMFPGLPIIRGKEEIRQMLKTNQGSEVSWEPKEAFVSMSGDLGYVHSLNYFKSRDSSGNTITTFNKGIEVWKRQPNGEWRCVVDIFNSDPSIKAIR